MYNSKFSIKLVKQQVRNKQKLNKSQKHNFVLEYQLKNKVLFTKLTKNSLSVWNQFTL